MRPVPIPDDHVWDGAQRVVIGPPGGDLTDEAIAPVEVLVDRDEMSKRYCMLLTLDDGDLERLQAGEKFWLVIRGEQLQPFWVGFSE